MSRRSRIFLLFLALTLVLTLLHSDDFFTVKDRIIGESRFKLGFLYFTPLMLLDNFGYTSSIYTHQAQDFPDWTGDMGVGLRTSAVAANRFILQAEELPVYSFYLKNDELRSWSNRFNATAYSHLGPLNLKIGFKRHDLRQRPQLEFSRPYHYRDSEWSGAIDVGRHSDIYLSAYVSASETTYDDDPYWGEFDLAASLSRRGRTFGLKLNKHVFTSTFVYANYESTVYRFASGSDRDASAQTLALGIEFPVIGVLQGGIQLGVKRFMPSNPDFKSMHTLNGRGQVRINMMERLTLSAHYDLDTLFSYLSDDLYYDHTTLGGGIEIYPTRFFKVGATYEEGRMKYHSWLDLQPQRSDRIRQQRYYLAVPFIGNTSLGFSYNIYRLTSDALGLDYTRHFWGGFISYEF